MKNYLKIGIVVGLLGTAGSAIYLAGDSMPAPVISVAPEDHQGLQELEEEKLEEVVEETIPEQVEEVVAPAPVVDRSPELRVLELAKIETAKQAELELQEAERIAEQEMLKSKKLLEDAEAELERLINESKKDWGDVLDGIEVSVKRHYKMPMCDRDFSSPQGAEIKKMIDYEDSFFRNEAQTVRDAGNKYLKNICNFVEDSEDELLRELTMLRDTLNFYYEDDPDRFDNELATFKELWLKLNAGTERIIEREARDLKVFWDNLTR